jgi:hypothetical protein
MTVNLHWKHLGLPEALAVNSCRAGESRVPSGMLISGSSTISEADEMSSAGAAAWTKKQNPYFYFYMYY